VLLYDNLYKTTIEPTMMNGFVQTANTHFIVAMPVKCTILMDDSNTPTSGDHGH
jgi:hypothetical protein